MRLTRLSSAHEAQVENFQWHDSITGPSVDASVWPEELWMSPHLPFRKRLPETRHHGKYLSGKAGASEQRCKS